MRRNHQRRLVIFLSVLCALACSIAVPAVPQEATGVEPLPPPAEIATPPSNHATASAAAEASPTASPSPSAPTARSAAPGGTAPEGIEVIYDENQKITWYRPKFDPWKMFDFRIFPSIARADDGARKICLSIVVKEPSKGRPTSLQVNTGEEPWVIPIPDSAEIKTHDSGCRVSQTIFLQNQAPFVQKLTVGPRAEIALMGYRHTVHYKMTVEDLANFRRIVALWSAPMLPPAPPKPLKDAPPEGAVEAGTSHVTNPEIIPSSKVRPRFPRFAQGKNVLGRVVLQAVILRDGTVGEIEVVRSAGGDCGFEEAAIEAVRQWRYKPGMKDGQPVEVYFTVVIDFTYGTYRMAPG